MKEFTWKLIVVGIAIIGNLTSIMVTIYQAFTNMFGAWFWFSFQSTLGWSMLISILRDIDWFALPKQGESK